MKRFFPKLFAKVTILAFPFLTGCASSLESTIGVDPEDNAVLCAVAEIRPMWTDSTATYKRIELPKGQNVTPEQLADIVRACGQ